MAQSKDDRDARDYELARQSAKRRARAFKLALDQLQAAHGVEVVADSDCGAWIDYEVRDPRWGRIVVPRSDL